MRGLSGWKKRLPDVIDSRQVSPGNLGLNLPQVKQPWHIQERRYLIFTRRGPVELVLRPKQVMAGVCLVITGLISSGWLAVQMLTSAVQVTHSEMAKPALAASLTGPAGLDIDALNPAQPDGSRWQAHREALPEPSDTPLPAQLSARPPMALPDQAPPAQTAADGLAEAGQSETVQLGQLASRLSELGPTAAQPGPEPLAGRDSPTSEEKRAPMIAQPLRLASAGARMAPAIAEKLSKPGDTQPTSLGVVQPPLLQDPANVPPDWQAAMGAPLVDERVRATRFYMGIEQEAMQMAQLLAELGIEAKPDMPALVQPDPALLKAGLDSPDFLLGLRDRVLLLEAYREIFRKIPFQPPMAHYYISSKYGMRTHPISKKWTKHHGLDMAGAWQESVLSPADGKVIFAGWEGSFGRVVRLQHAHGITTTYAHLGRISVVLGQQVTEGTILGRMGSSGRSDGLHLHFEIRVNGESRDPEKFFAVGRKLMGRGTLRPGTISG